MKPLEGERTTARLSTKGRLVLPKAVRERHGWAAGTLIEIVEQGDAVLIRSAEALTKTRLEDLAGCTGYRGPALALDEMDSAIEREALRRR